MSILSMRGWAYYNLDLLQQALDDFDLAIKIDRKKSDLHRRRADILFDLDRYKEAITGYTKAIELAPDSLDYFVSRGVAYEMIKKNRSALRDYNHVLASDSSNELALRNRAILYCFQFNDSTDGLRDWNRLLSVKFNSNYLFERAQSYLKFKNFKKAIRDLDLALGFDSEEDYKYLAFRGYSYGMEGQLNQALNDFARSFQLKPDNEYSFKLRGEVYLKAGMKKEACDDFEMALMQNESLMYLKRKCR